MVWKKAWPTQIKNQLRALGISDTDIDVLERYGSLDEFNRDPRGVLKGARKQAVLDLLTEAGIID